MAEILLVEDNDEIRESVKSYLELENNKVYDFSSSKGVYELLDRKNIDIAILDVMLPEESGFLIAKKIKKEHDIPIVFLTAKAAESDRITGFELGADDYVVKPFSPRELVLRVNAILKRTGKKSLNNKDEILKFKHKNFTLIIDNKTHSVKVNDNEIYLTKNEWEILLYLAKNSGTVISRERLLGECLDYYIEGPERTVDTHIKNIRAKLGEKSWIETVRNYGYKFAGEKI